MIIGLFMLLADRMVNILDSTLGKKNSFAVVFEMLAYMVPHYLGTAIPAALFLGLLLGFSKMSANSETDAFMASGVSLHRLAMPVILLGVLLSLISLGILGWIQPYARYAYRSVIFDVQNVDVFYLAEEGVFMQAGDRTFIIDKLDRGKNVFQRAFIFQDKGAEGSETVTSTRGALIESPDGRRPILHLEDGHRLSLKSKPSPDSALVPAEVTEFALADTPLGKLSKDIFRPRGEDEHELTISELIAQFDTPPSESNPFEMSSELNERLVTALSILILPFLAIPFAVGSRRSARSIRIGFALALVVLYHEIIQQGAKAVARGDAPAYLTLWLPFVLLGAFAIWRYAMTCFTLKADPIASVMERIGDSFRRLWAALKNGLGQKRAA